MKYTLVKQNKEVYVHEHGKEFQKHYIEQRKAKKS